MSGVVFFAINPGGCKNETGVYGIVAKLEPLWRLGNEALVCPGKKFFKVFFLSFLSREPTISLTSAEPLSIWGFIGMIQWKYQRLMLLGDVYKQGEKQWIVQPSK